MNLVFIVNSGEHAGRKIRIEPGQTRTFGRGRQVDFSFAGDSFMSSKHFSVSYDPPDSVLRDLGTRNGTTVNSQRAGVVPLRSGDSIFAGATQFAVAFEDAPAPPDASPTDRSESTDVRGDHVKKGPLPPTRERPIHQEGVMIAAPRTFRIALHDEEPSVVTEALLAAVWTRQPWLFNYCQTAAQRVAPKYATALWLLAVLGDASDLDSLLSIGGADSLGPERFSILASYGHPGLFEPLLEAIGAEDPATAAAAGTAFKRMTGVDIDSEETMSLSAEGTDAVDEFDREFDETVFRPDADAADRHYRSHRDRYADGARWACGIDLTALPDAETLDRLDMRSRWEAVLRGCYWNNGSQIPVDGPDFFGIG